MESALSKHLFVYSSLRKGFHQHTHDYIARFFSFVSPAKVKGVMKNVNGEIFATPGDDNSFIEGELYKLNDEHDFSYVFGQLDDYEGLIVEQGQKALYKRELITVHKDNGEKIDAWLYWFNGDITGKPALTPGERIYSNA